MPLQNQEQILQHDFSRKGLILGRIQRESSLSSILFFEGVQNTSSKIPLQFGFISQLWETTCKAPCTQFLRSSTGMW